MTENCTICNQFPPLKFIHFCESCVRKILSMFDEEIEEQIQIGDGATIALVEDGKLDLHSFNGA